MDKWASDGRAFFQIPHVDVPDSPRRAGGASSPAEPSSPRSPAKLPQLSKGGNVGTSSEAAPASSPRRARVTEAASPESSLAAAARNKLLHRQDTGSLPSKMAMLQRSGTKTLQRNGTSVFGLVKGAVNKEEEAKGDDLMNVIADAKRKAYSQSLENDIDNRVDAAASNAANLISLTPEVPAPALSPRGPPVAGPFERPKATRHCLSACRATLTRAH